MVKNSPQIDNYPSESGSTDDNGLIADGENVTEAATTSQPDMNSTMSTQSTAPEATESQPPEVSQPPAAKAAVDPQHHHHHRHHHHHLHSHHQQPAQQLPSAKPQSAVMEVTRRPSYHQSASTNDDNRYCWVCFATDEDDELAAWVQPCKCSGTTKWVHQLCLQRWVDEKQKGNSFKRVNCPQCQTEYIIIFPEMGTFVGILEGIDTIVQRLSPFLAVGVVVGSLYWTAVTYGAVTVLQVLGHKNGLEVLERADPLVLLIGLPAIPAGLILGRMFSWEEMVLRFIQSRQQAARKFPLLNLILPVPEETESTTQGPAQAPVLTDPLSATRIFCGALLMPTVSAIVGRIFFDSIQNNLHRTLIGGLSFILVKGGLKMYFKHKQHTRKKQRKILDFNDENIRRFVGPTMVTLLNNQQQQRARQSYVFPGENLF